MPRWTLHPASILNPMGSISALRGVRDVSAAVDKASAFDVLMAMFWDRESCGRRSAAPLVTVPGDVCGSRRYPVDAQDRTMCPKVSNTVDLQVDERAAGPNPPARVWGAAAQPVGWNAA